MGDGYYGVCCKAYYHNPDGGGNYRTEEPKCYAPGTHCPGTGATGSEGGVVTSLLSSEQSTQSGEKYEHTCATVSDFPNDDVSINWFNLGTLDYDSSKWRTKGRECAYLPRNAPCCLTSTSGSSKTGICRTVTTYGYKRLQHEPAAMLANGLAGLLHEEEGGTVIGSVYLPAHGTLVTLLCSPPFPPPPSPFPSRTSSG